MHSKKLCVTLVIYQESGSIKLHNRQFKTNALFSKCYFVGNQMKEDRICGKYCIVEEKTNARIFLIGD
jgi:hypothetical protein